MRVNILEFVVQVLLLVRVPFASAAAVSYFVPRAGAADVCTNGGYKDADLSRQKKLIAGTKDHIERMVQSQWEKQRRWTAVYKRRSKEIRLARIAKLVFVTAGGLLQIAATPSTSFVGACFIGLGTLVDNQFLTYEKEKLNLTSFYISQILKSEVYRFRTRCRPYDGPIEDAVELLRKRCNGHSKLSHDRKFRTMGPDEKAIPVDMTTKEDYIKYRVQNRIDKFLFKKGRGYARRAQFCSFLENGFVLGGAVIGFLTQTVLPPGVQSILAYVSGFPAYFTVVSTAIGSYQMKWKFEEIADQYYDTADELRDIMESWPENCNKAGDPGWYEQIDKCEDLIMSTTEEFAKKRTGNDELTFPKPTVPAIKRNREPLWNPNVYCGDDESGSYPAKDRAQWLVENVEGMTMDRAQKQVMKEFPKNF